MTLTEIKKELYKQKPMANLLYIRKGIAYYETYLTTMRYPDNIHAEPYMESIRVIFEIPVNDMGDADFTPTMDAKLLNRWLSESIV